MKREFLDSQNSKCGILKINQYYYLPQSSFWLKCFQDHSQETIVRIWKFLRLFIADAIIFPKAPSSSSIIRGPQQHQAINARTPNTKKCRPDNLLGGSYLAVPPGEKRCSYTYFQCVFGDLEHAFLYRVANGTQRVKVAKQVQNS